MILTNRFTALSAALLLGFPAIAQESGTTATAPTPTPEASADSAATAKTDTAKTAPADPATVMATVNGTDITLGHMIALRDRLPQQYQSLPDEVLFKALLDQLIQQTALIDTTPGADSKRLELTVENEVRALKADAALQQKLAEKLTDEKLKAAYDEQVANAEPTTEWNASHILVKTEDEAKQIVKDLEGGADFATLAKEKSTGPSGPNGGELGWFSKGQMVPEFETAVEGMKPGAISAPVQTQFGWHVVKLNETRTAETPPFEAVRDQLEQALAQKETQAIMEEATAAADVTRPETDIAPGTISQSDLLDK